MRKRYAREPLLVVPLEGVVITEQDLEAIRRLNEEAKAGRTRARSHRGKWLDFPNPLPALWAWLSAPIRAVEAWSPSGALASSRAWLSVKAQALPDVRAALARWKTSGLPSKLTLPRVPSLPRPAWGSVKLHPLKGLDLKRLRVSPVSYLKLSFAKAWLVTVSFVFRKYRAVSELWTGLGAVWPRTPQVRSLLASRSAWGLPTWQLYAAGVLTLLLLAGVGRMFLNPGGGTAPTLVASASHDDVPDRSWETQPAETDPPVHELERVLARIEPLAPLELEQAVPEAIAESSEADREAPASAPASAPEPEPKPEPAVTTTEINGATIQVGAFRDRANVDRLVERLREVHDQVQVIQLDNELYRVTMGPFLERQTADGIARELDAEMHLSTRVIEAPMVQVRIAAQ